VERKADRGQKLDNFDPPLLPQSMQLVRLQAELIYRERVQISLKKNYKNQSHNTLVFRQDCVNRAQQHVIDLLKANSQPREETITSQSVECEEMVLDAQPSVRGPEEKWQEVWAQVRAERKQIVCELENLPGPEQVRIS
jgi:hypothetical protein